MRSATADTNIYISAFNFGGQPYRFVEMARDGAFRLDISEPILEEIKRILRSKFQWDEERVQGIVEQLGDFTHHVTPTQALDVIKEDRSDNRILECATEARSDAIVSGDGDLLRLGQHGLVPIMKVSDFLRSCQPPSGRRR